MNALTAGLSLGAAQGAFRAGVMPEREFRRYERAWTWSAFRYSPDAGETQDRYWLKHGQDAFYRRIDRVRRALRLQPIKRETIAFAGGRIGQHGLVIL